MRRRIAVSAVVLLVAAGLPALGAVKYVDASASGANDGTSWTDAYTNLQTALGSSASGTDLWIAQGTYSVTNQSDRSATFTVPSGVNLYGGFTNGMSSLGERNWLEYPAVLSGDIGVRGSSADNSYHILTSAGGGILDGLTFADGNASEGTTADGRGAAVYHAAGSALIVRNCLFTRNRSTGNANGCGTLMTTRPGLLATNCVFAGNTCGYAVLDNRANNALVANCVFLNNYSANTSARILNSPAHLNTLTVDRTTFHGNSGYQVGKYHNGFWTVRQCILWGNDNTFASARFQISYSDVEGCGGSGAGWSLAAADYGGNIDADPLFVAGPTGLWSHAASYDAAADRTSFYDTSASFGADALKGRFLNPDRSGRHGYYIVSSSATQLVVHGDATALGAAGNAYEVEDVHLQATEGHWSFGGAFVADTQDSPCLDAGDPGGDYSGEPTPNGYRLNIGAYAGTPQASKSLDQTPPGPVSQLAALAGDGQAELRWINPSSTDLQGVLVLRRENAAPTGTPADRTAYSVGDTIGDGAVVYVGAGSDGTPGNASGWTDSAPSVTNGHHYFYAVFAYDPNPLYAGGRTADTTPAAGAGVSPFYVDGSATGANNGTSWTDAYTSLGAALTQAGSGDEVRVAEGLYKPGVTRSESFRLPAGAAVYGGYTNGMSDASARSPFDFPTILSGDIGVQGDYSDNSYHVVDDAAGAVLNGFWIRDGNANVTGDTTGGGLYNDAANLTVAQCVFLENRASGDGSAFYNWNANGLLVSGCVFAVHSGSSVFYGNPGGNNGAVLKNCIFMENSASRCIYQPDESIEVINCTFTENSGPAAATYYSNPLYMRNCIVQNDGSSLAAGTSSSMYIKYCNIKGSSAAGYWAPDSRIYDEGGNIDTNAQFVNGPTGTWSQAAVYDAGAGRTTLTDASGGFTPDALKGRFINPDASGRYWYYIASNTSTQLVVLGDASFPGGGEQYRVLDVHLKSTAGHWAHGDNWVSDALTSPCVAAGDPTDDNSNEPAPNGGRINMGAYGNTAQASKMSVPPPDPVTGLVPVAGDAEVRLRWVNPLSGLFDGVLVLRNTTGAPAGAPSDGTPYTVGEFIGTDEVVYLSSNRTAGAAELWTNSPAANGTHFYYSVYAYDSLKQYSTAELADATPSAAAGQSPIYVNDDASGANNGTSWTDAYTDLRSALYQAGAGTNVWVAEGTYKPGQSREDSFVLQAGQKLYGGFTTSMTSPDQRDWLLNPSVLSGDIDGDGLLNSGNSMHVLTGAADALVDGFTFRLGYGSGAVDADRRGSAVTCNGDGFRLINSFVAENYDSGNKDGGAGAVYTSGQDTLISNCVFSAHTGWCVVYLHDNRGLVRNCLFIDNGASYATVFEPSGISQGGTVLNCSFFGNAATQVHKYYRGTMYVSNSIIWGNSGTIGWNSDSIVEVSYCDIEGSGGSAGWTFDPVHIVDQGSNIDVNPLFVGEVTGAWTADSAYDAAADRTRLTHAGAGLRDDELRGRFLNPNTAGRHAFYVASNTASEVYIVGNASWLGTNGAAYSVVDCHLQSKQGRWTPGGWRYDLANSPCIDAGDPALNYLAEPEPNGFRLNLGAYGNTLQASKTDVKEGSLIMVR